MRPSCRRPYTRGQTLKNSTITSPPPSPIITAHTIAIAIVPIVRKREQAGVSTNSEIAINRFSGTKRASQPPMKFPARPVIAVTTSVW